MNITHIQDLTVNKKKSLRSPFNISQRSSLEDWPSTLYTIYISSVQNCVSNIQFIPSIYVILLITSINFNFIDLKGREGGRERGGREVRGKKTKKGRIKSEKEEEVEGDKIKKEEREKREGGSEVSNN